MDANNLELMPLKDPVCLMTIDPCHAVAMAEHRGQAYYFCSEGCRQKFLAQPEIFLDKAPSLRLTVGMMGSASGKIAPTIKELVYTLGQDVAERGFILITGACPGLPYECARGARNKGCRLEGARALVVGCGGVGSAIAASLAKAGVAALDLYDRDVAVAEGLAQRLRQHCPSIEVRSGRKDPAGFGIVVNATPMGMSDGDPLPMDASRIDAGAFVGEVVMREEMTPFLQAAAARGARVQVGLDMLFEQIPAYLEFFGLPSATPAALRRVARLD